MSGITNPVLLMTLLRKMPKEEHLNYLESIGWPAEEAKDWLASWEQVKTKVKRKENTVRFTETDEYAGIQSRIEKLKARKRNR